MSDIYKITFQFVSKRIKFIVFIVAYTSLFLFLQQRYSESTYDINKDSFKNFNSTSPSEPQDKVVQPSTEIDNYVSKALRKIRYGFSNTCEPVFNIMYLKTHKCASSTMQNILYRYACTHNKKHQSIPCGVTTKEKIKEGQDYKYRPILREGSNKSIGYNNDHKREDDDIIVAVPPEGVYAGNPVKFRPEMLYKPKWLLNVNLFGLHARLDPYQMQRVVQPNALWITVLRKPVDQYTSLYYYFKLNSATGVPLEQFVEKPLSVMKNQKRLDGRLGSNQMTFDLGYDPDVFYNDDKIDDMIGELEDTFDFILISEKLDQSLVLLGHALCWSLDDLISLRKNVRSKKSSLTPQGENKLKMLNHADARIYDHFYKKFERIAQLYGKEKLLREEELLRAKRDEAEKYCVEGVVKGHNSKAFIKEYSADVLGFQLSKPEDPFCRALAWNSKQYINYFRQSMKRKFN